ncbi:hypothetical protein EC988_005160, partial [Linderina pennispora]
MSLIVEAIAEYSIRNVVVAAASIYVICLLVKLFVPPSINDGGVPHIPAYKTLYWT